MMRKWFGEIFLASISALVFIAALLWLGLWYFIPTPPSNITIAAAVSVRQRRRLRTDDPTGCRKSRHEAREAQLISAK
jgi:hypothetical protein